MAKAVRTIIDGVEYLVHRGRLLPTVSGGEGDTAVVRSIEELESRAEEIRSELEQLDKDAEGKPLAGESREQWNTLTEEREQVDKDLEEARAELQTRRETIERMGRRGNGHGEPGAEFHTPSPGSARGDDIYDLSTIRMSMDNPASGLGELRSRAKRSVESATFPALRGLTDDHCREHIEGLIDRFDTPDGSDAVPGEISRRILATGSPTYQRAFVKHLAGKPLESAEARALSVGTGSAGGFAIVYTLDPTIIPTSNLSVNPYRRIARQETIAGTNEWRGVTSAGVSATRVAEATEATDGSPTLAQPAVVVQRVQTFIPFSIELGQDWGSLQTDMAQLIQDAKDDEEATSFTTGTGTPPAAQGVITGATTTVAANGVASFAVGDLYALEQALGPRFRPRAVFLGNRFTYNKVRQFDTAGGASLWAPYPAPLKWGLENQGGPENPQAGNMNAELIGYPANEASAMASALTTGSKILVLGDFRYFIVVDRIGLDIEIVPHLFGASNRFPTGQRGIFAYWRNNSKVLDANAFRTLVTG